LNKEVRACGPKSAVRCLVFGSYISLELAGKETKLFYFLMTAFEDLGKSAVYSYWFFCSFVWKRVCTVIDHKV